MYLVPAHRSFLTRQVHTCIRIYRSSLVCTQFDIDLRIIFSKVKNKSEMSLEYLHEREDFRSYSEAVDINDTYTQSHNLDRFLETTVFSKLCWHEHHSTTTPLEPRAVIFLSRICLRIWPEIFTLIARFMYNVYGCDFYTRCPALLGYLTSIIFTAVKNWTTWAL